MLYLNLNLNLHSNIDLIQAPISGALTTFIDHVGNSKSGSITAVTIGTAGTGYAVGDVLTLAAESGGTAATVVVKTIGSNGEISTVEVVDGGSGYNGSSSVSVSAPNSSGSGAAAAGTMTVTDITSLFTTIQSMNDSLAQ